MLGMQLRGPAQSLQVAKMGYENKLTRQAIKRIQKELELSFRWHVFTCFRAFYGVFMHFVVGSQSFQGCSGEDRPGNELLRVKLASE